MEVGEAEWGWGCSGLINQSSFGRSEQLQQGLAGASRSKQMLASNPSSDNEA